MKFEDLKLETRSDGVYCRVKFDNGYGASVVSHAMSYGGKEGLYEVAVLRGDSITYETPVTNDVLGWLEPADVERVLGDARRPPVRPVGRPRGRAGPRLTAQLGPPGCKPRAGRVRWPHQPRRFPMADSKTWTRDEIDSLLRSNPRAVERAMMRLYELQTQDERHASTTKHDNARGFSSAFAARGSYYARWVAGGRGLTGAHLERARRIALVHSKQLLKIANGATP